MHFSAATAVGVKSLGELFQHLTLFSLMPFPTSDWCVHVHKGLAIHISHTVQSFGL